MIDLRPDHLKIVLDILHEHVPDREVRAFGSRATWTAKDHSDLDLAIVGKEKLDWQLLARIKEAFSDSDLPIRVDVLDWHGISDSFRKVIEKGYEVIQVCKGNDRRKTVGWREVSLGSVANFFSGGTPAKGDPRYWGGSIPWVSAKDMKRFRLDDTEDHVTELGVANGTRLTPAGSVMLLVRGMTLHNDVPICIVKRPMAFNQDVKAVCPKPDLRSDFLPYVLLGNKDRLLGLVDSAGHGTGRLNTDELKSLSVLLPPEPEQRAIAHVLGALDDKIELNRRMNETLESMARALFKSWFVDFDPVRAKSEGRDPCLPTEIVDLFPGAFEDSELGLIPAGWEVKELGEVFELAYGRALKAGDRREGNVPVYGSNGQIGWHNQRLASGPGIVVGRKGNPGTVTWAPKDFFAIDTAFFVVPSGICSSMQFLFHALEILDLASLGADSAVSGLNRKLAYMSKQVVPPPPILEEFDKYATGISERVDRGDSGRRTLAALRDALLPRLLSGEIRVDGPVSIDPHRFRVE
ncbi:MAG: restriction endonuclease subunit S [Candidatus Coatesbacteria bacterium]